MKAYVAEAAKANGQEQGEFIIGAIELDRGLAERLAIVGERLAEFARQEGLALETDAAEVLSRLALKGLEQFEAHRKPKK